MGIPSSWEHGADHHLAINLNARGRFACGFDVRSKVLTYKDVLPFEVYSACQAENDEFIDAYSAAVMRLMASSLYLRYPIENLLRFDL